MNPKEETPAFLKAHKQIKETIDMTKKSRSECQAPPIGAALRPIVLWTIDNPSGGVQECGMATGYSPETVLLIMETPQFQQAVDALYRGSVPRLLYETE